MKYRNSQQGFSAVELLITLFIGSMFLISGYLIWGYTQRSSDEGYQDAIASNITYAYLRRYTASACGTALPTDAVPTPAADIPTISDLLNPRITITISCPTELSSLGLAKVTSTLTYGSGDTARSITHAVYTK